MTTRIGVAARARAHRQKRPGLYCPGDNGRCLHLLWKQGRVDLCRRHPNLCTTAVLTRSLEQLRREQPTETGNTSATEATP